MSSNGNSTQEVSPNRGDVDACGAFLLWLRKHGICANEVMVGQVQVRFQDPQALPLPSQTSATWTDDDSEPVDEDDVDRKFADELGVKIEDGGAENE